MGSLDSVQTRQILAEGTVEQRNDDQPIAIMLRYKGTGSVTSVTVTTGTNIVMITSDGGTDTYAFGTYTTISSLIAAINGDNIFEAKVLDALLSDATATQFVDGAITATTDGNGVITWNVLVDTSAADKASVCLTPRKNWDAPKGHRVHLQELSYYENVSAGEAGAVRIYRRRGAVETLIFGALSVDATITTVNFASGQGKITGKPDDEFIFRVQDATSITDSTSNYVRVTGIIE